MDDMNHFIEELIELFLIREMTEYLSSQSIQQTDFILDFPILLQCIAIYVEIVGVMLMNLL